MISVCHGRIVNAAGASGRLSLCISSQEAERRINDAPPSAFSQCKISAQAMALPTVRLGLLLSVNPIYRLAPRYDQMLVS